MLFGLNVAGDLTVNIDMAAGDNIADEMHPLAMTVVSCFLLATASGSGLIAGGVAASDI
jgi:hypothetical protein